MFIQEEIHKEINKSTNSKNISRKFDFLKNEETHEHKLGQFWNIIKKRCFTLRYVGSFHWGRSRGRHPDRRSGEDIFVAHVAGAAVEDGPVGLELAQQRRWPILAQ